jgi:transketolase
VIYDDSYRFQIGKAHEIKSGTDATVIACGVMVASALDAARQLAREGIDCRVVNMSTLKPIDETAIARAAEETGAIVTAEEHQEAGGLGSIVARIAARHHPVPMEFVAVKDVFGESGKPAELLEKYGLTAKDITVAIKAVIKRKSQSR